MRRCLLALLTLPLLGACSVRSIDSVTDTKLKLCREIHDEALRVDCIKHADDRQGTNR